MNSIVIPMQRSILKATEREQERIGQELHDGLGQHLTGIAFLAKALARKLADKGAAEASDAEKLVQLINRSVSMTRNLAHGLRPVGDEDNALMSALRQMAIDVADLFKIECRFINDEPVHIVSQYVSHHLFRIAQEAVNNAIKHGHPNRIDIELELKPRRGGKHSNIVLTISNDGALFASDVDNNSGMGLAGMRYRAQLIGAKIAFRKLQRPVGVSVTVDERKAQTLEEPPGDGELE